MLCADPHNIAGGPLMGCGQFARILISGARMIPVVAVAIALLLYLKKGDFTHKH